MLHTLGIPAAIALASVAGAVAGLLLRPERGMCGV